MAVAVVGGGSGSGDDFLRGSHLDYWYNASFDSVEDAFDYHYLTHVVQAGYSQTPEEYTSDALAFSNGFAGRWAQTPLADETVGWYGSASDGQGGVYSADWSIVSYWYR